MKQLHAFVMAIGLLSIFNTLMPCGPASAELDTQFNAAGVFSGISGTAEIRFPSGAQLLDLEFRGVVTDAENNIYLGGFLSDPPTRFLAYKLTSTGLPVWFTALPEFSAGSNDRANGIAIDQSGCVYLGGTTEDSGLLLFFAAAKLDNAGNTIWMTEVPSIDPFAEDLAHGIAVDASGDVYLGGQAAVGIGIPRFAAAKLNNVGSVIWTTALSDFNAGSADVANGVAIDDLGNVYLGGISNPVVGSNQFAAAKLNNSGGTIWMSSGSFSVGFSEAYGIAVDENGEVYLGGTIGSLAAAKLDGISGAVIWTSVLSLTGVTETAFGIVLDGFGCVYLGGEVDPIGINNKQFAAVKLDTDGELNWSFIVPQFGQTALNEIAFGIALDAQRAVVLAGLTDSTSRGGVAKLIQQFPLPSGPLPSPLLALPFIPMAAA